MIGWPSTLPWPPLRGAYSESPPNPIIRTQMDAAEAKTRRRFTSMPETSTGRLELTNDECNILRSFLINDLAGGALPFTASHPRTGGPAVIKIVPPLRIDGIADSEDFSVDIALEIRDGSGWELNDGSGYWNMNDGSGVWEFNT
jgi:hypothetical protein